MERPAAQGGEPAQPAAGSARGREGVAAARWENLTYSKAVQRVAATICSTRKRLYAVGLRGDQNSNFCHHFGAALSNTERLNRPAVATVNRALEISEKLILATLFSCSLSALDTKSHKEQLRFARIFE